MSKCGQRGVPSQWFFFSSHVDWYRRGSKEVNDLAPSKNNDLPKKKCSLVGLEHVYYFLFFHILGMSSSQLTLWYFFRGVGQPPTSSNTSNIFQCIQAKLEIDLALAKMFGFSQAPSRVPPCWGHLPSEEHERIKKLDMWPGEQFFFGRYGAWAFLIVGGLYYTPQLFILQSMIKHAIIYIYIYCNKCQFTQWYW